MRPTIKGGCRSLITALPLSLLIACGQPSDPASQSTSVPETTIPTANRQFLAQGWVNSTLPELSAALKTGKVSSAALTNLYLARIDAIDRSGPSLNSVLAINPDAARQAEASDARREAGTTIGPLDGVPILLKDNIETADPIPTTAGSTALANNRTGRDSPLVAGLRAAGAVILGKTNLSQWANFRSEHSISGWSSVGDLVKNPHSLDRTACGSSSGSGAAVAAALAAAAVGTETNGSIICPAHVNGIVGFKPTVGLISAEHIVPISPTQDTAGPMTRTVAGAAMMLDAMAGSGQQFADAIGSASLKGLRIGVLNFSVGSQPHIQRRFQAIVDDLAEQGATVVAIDEFSVPDEFWGNELTILKTEFKASLDDYLAGSPADIPVQSLKDLIEFNKAAADTELAFFGQDLFEASQRQPSIDDEAFQTTLATTLRQARAEGIDRLLNDYGVEVLVSPSGPIAPRADTVNGDVFPEWSGAGYLAAVAGYPHLTVPMGTVRGIPLGLSFMASAGGDARVLAIGHAWEQSTQSRVEPRFRPQAPLPGEDPR